jgi:hypothetical protein
VTTISPRQLEQALRACSRGIRHHEAGTSLLIECGHWLHRDDFTSRFIEHGTSEGILMAAIDWDAASTALRAGRLPASSGERRTLLLAASIADGVPVSLSDTLVGIDRRTAGLVVSAVARATGLQDQETDKRYENG